MRSRRAILAVLIGAAALIILDVPLRMVYLWCLRTACQVSQSIGLVNTQGSLGGQVMGFNYHRAPTWVHFADYFLAAAVAFAPAVLVTVLLVRRCTRSHHAAHCGRCGSVLQALAEPQCPHCRRPL